MEAFWLTWVTSLACCLRSRILLLADIGLRVLSCSHPLSSFCEERETNLKLGRANYERSSSAGRLRGAEGVVRRRILLRTPEL